MNNNFTLINMKTRISLIAIIAFLMTLTVVTPSYASERSASRLNCVTGEDLIRNGDTDLMRALRGRIAGLNISAYSTNSADGFSTTMRGISSLNGSNKPLYIVDGMQVESIEFVNIYDVELVQVLKHNEAFSLYGSRAANGAIVITTKRR